MQDALQPAYVAWPAVEVERTAHLGRQRTHWQAVALRIFFDEIVCALPAALQIAERPFVFFVIHCGGLQIPNSSFISAHALAMRAVTSRPPTSWIAAMVAAWSRITPPSDHSMRESPGAIARSCVTTRQLHKPAPPTLLG